jgi:hypothetical protein
MGSAEGINWSGRLGLLGNSATLRAIGREGYAGGGRGCVVVKLAPSGRPLEEPPYQPVSEMLASDRQAEEAVRAAEVAESQLASLLPPRYLPRYIAEPTLLARFYHCLAAVTWRLARPAWLPLSRVAEQLALRGIIDHAEALLEMRLDTGGDPPGWEERYQPLYAGGPDDEDEAIDFAILREVLARDDDIAFLFDERFDGIAGGSRPADPHGLAATGPLVHAIRLGGDARHGRAGRRRLPLDATCLRCPPHRHPRAVKPDAGSACDGSRHGLLARDKSRYFNRGGAAVVLAMRSQCAHGVLCTVGLCRISSSSRAGP